MRSFVAVPMLLASFASFAAAPAPKTACVQVPLTVREYRLLDQMAAARTLRPEELALRLYREGLRRAADVLPPPAPVAPRLVPAEKPEASVRVKDGAKIAFAGDYFMEHGNVAGLFVPQVMRGLEVAGVKNAVKVPAWSRGEQTGKMAERMEKLAAGDADWIVFCGGADDLIRKPRLPLDETRKNLARAFDAFAASGKHVIVMTLIPLGLDKPTRDIDAVIREEAEKRGLPVADVERAYEADPVLCGYASHESSPVIARLLLERMGVGGEVAQRVAEEAEQTPGSLITSVTMRMPADEAAAAGKVKAKARDFIVARLEPVPVRKDRFAVLCGIDDGMTVRTLRGLTGKAHPTALLFTTASGDDPNQILRITGTFGGQKVRHELVRLCGKEKVDADALKAKMLDSDIIWLGSGCTERLQEKIAQYGLAETFRAAYEKGVVMAGYSAGAIMLCHAGYNDFNDGRYDLIPGLGLVKAYVGPHYQLPKWVDFDKRLEQEKDASLPSVAWALEDWTLVVYRNGEPDARRIRDKADVYRFDRKDGKWTKSIVKSIVNRGE